MIFYTTGSLHPSVENVLKEYTEILGYNENHLPDMLVAMFDVPAWYGDYNHQDYKYYRLCDRVVYILGKYISFPWRYNYDNIVMFDTTWELDLSKVRFVEPSSTDGGKFTFI